MSELNQLRKSTEHRGALRRVALMSAVLILALHISLPLTMKAHAVGQLTITISNAGMTPTSATASGGIVHLKITNSSTRDTLTLRLNRENGALVREIMLPEGTRELSTEVEIGAGQYSLTETSNATWTCALTIQ